MSTELALGVFDSEEKVLKATRATLAAGHQIQDVYTPYAVHGLDEVMGLKPSRLSWVCLGFGLVGLLTAVFAQFWIGSIDWPLNVGGRPFNSLPAYLPVAFETTVLIGGLGVVFVFFVQRRLYPGKQARLVDPGVSNDRFVIAVKRRDSSWQMEDLFRLWNDLGATEARRLETEP